MTVFLIKLKLFTVTLLINLYAATFLLASDKNNTQLRPLKKFTGLINISLSKDAKAIGVPAALIYQFANIIDQRSIFNIKSLQKNDQFTFLVDSQKNTLISASIYRSSQNQGLLALMEYDKPEIFEIYDNALTPLFNTVSSPLSGRIDSKEITTHFGEKGVNSKPHFATDIDLDKGDPVFSVLPGKVIKVDSSGKTAAGLYVIIEHKVTTPSSLPKTFYTLYAHLMERSILVKEGEAISTIKIASGGNSGRVKMGKGNDGSHLHLAAYKLSSKGGRHYFDIEGFLPLEQSIRFRSR